MSLALTNAANAVQQEKSYHLNFIDFSQFLSRPTKMRVRLFVRGFRNDGALTMARQQQQLCRFLGNGRSFAVACVAMLALAATVELGHGGVLLFPHPGLPEAAENSDIV